MSHAMYWSLRPLDEFIHNQNNKKITIILKVKEGYTYIVRHDSGHLHLPWPSPQSPRCKLHHPEEYHPSPQVFGYITNNTIIQKPGMCIQNTTGICSNLDILCFWMAGLPHNQIPALAYQFSTKAQHVASSPNNTCLSTSWSQHLAIYSWSQQKVWEEKAWCGRGGGLRTKVNTCSMISRIIPLIQQYSESWAYCKFIVSTGMKKEEEGWMMSGERRV